MEAATNNSDGAQQRRSAEEWRRIFERRASSGLSVATFCQREGIAQSSYKHWRTKLAHAAREVGVAVSHAETGFVDVGSLGTHASAEASKRINLTLELGHGIVLHVVRG